jgi:DNA-binding transcriptional ArsR family regulator
MIRTPPHPDPHQLEAPHILDCLSEPIRLAIVVMLIRQTESAGELRCGDFSQLSSKSNLSYHMVKLRDAGLIRSRITGHHHFVQLRAAELEERFPGLLRAIVDAATRSSSIIRLLAESSVSLSK